MPISGRRSASAQLDDLRQSLAGRVGREIGWTIVSRPDLLKLDEDGRWGRLEALAIRLGPTLPQDEAGGRRHRIATDAVALSQRIFPTDESQFEYHTDGSYLVDPHDVRYVLLFCETPAAHGGETLLLQATELIAWLELHCPASLKRLQAPVRFLVDRALPGAPASDIVEAPALRRVGQDWLVRLHRWRMFQAVGGDQAALRALQDLGAAFDDLSPTARFVLQPGDILVIDNTRVLHARTAFDEPPPPAPRRTLLRLWAGNAPKMQTSTLL